MLWEMEGERDIDIPLPMSWIWARRRTGLRLSVRLRAIRLCISVLMLGCAAGMMDWDNTSIVFTKRTLLEFLKYVSASLSHFFIT